MKILALVRQKISGHTKQQEAQQQQLQPAYDLKTKTKFYGLVWTDRDRVDSRKKLTVKSVMQKYFCVKKIV